MASLRSSAPPRRIAMMHLHGACPSWRMAHDLLVFVTWKTWASAVSLDEEIAAHLREALPRLAGLEGASLIELAIVGTHVHAVVEVTALTDIPRLVQRMKGASARFANRDGWSSTGRLLRWERGYDARTVARSGLPQLRHYLDGQAEKHGRPLLVRWSSGASIAA